MFLHLGGGDVRCDCGLPIVEKLLPIDPFLVLLPETEHTLSSTYSG